MPFAKVRWLHSLATKLLITYVAALLLTAGVIAAVVWIATGRDINITSRFDLNHESDMIQESLQFDATGRPVSLRLPSDSAWIYELLSADLKYRIVDATGTVLLASETGAGALAPSGSPFDPRVASFDFFAHGERLLVRTVPIAHGHTTYYVQVATSERLAMLKRAVLRHALVAHTLRIVMGSMFVFSLAVCFTLRRVLKPLREASIAAARIDPRNLSARLETGNLPVELSPVIDAFNLVLDRLEKGYRVQQEFLAGAAHELKTPLALLRAQIEMDPSGDRTVLLPDLDLMARQVHQLLHLAEVSEVRNYVFEITQVSAVAEDVVSYLRRLASRRGVYLDLHCAPTGPALQADRGALFMLLKNVLENAIQHSPQDGVVAVTIEDKALSIRDEGPGISAGDLPHLFTRFWRGVGRRDDGAGLGLAICQEIVTAHGWQLSARSTGHGAEFTLAF